MASGFALRRNGSCLATETECFVTVFPYHACCPFGSFCPQQHNAECCPTAANCTQTLLQDPQCANAEWDLFINRGYFFCCLRGLAGYGTPAGTDGCAEAGYKFQEGEQLLEIISTGKSDICSGFFRWFRKRLKLKAATSVITPLRGSTTSSLRNQSDSNISAIKSSPAFNAPLVPKTDITVVETDRATTSETTSSSTSSASTAPKTGTIVGGSVGAVLAVVLLALAAWFLLVQRRRGRQTKDSSSEGAGIVEADHPNVIHEKNSRFHVPELPDKIAHEIDSRPLYELAVARPAETSA